MADDLLGKGTFIKLGELREVASWLRWNSSYVAIAKYKDSLSLSIKELQNLQKLVLEDMGLKSND